MNSNAMQLQFIKLTTLPTRITFYIYNLKTVPPDFFVVLLRLCCACAPAISSFSSKDIHIKEVEVPIHTIVGRYLMHGMGGNTNNFIIIIPILLHKIMH